MKKKATKAIAYCAMFTALSIIMARVLSISAPNGIRWSADKFPLFLAGMFFGPLMGALTGFAADFLGSIMQYGFNPLLCPPAILYGLFGGLMRWFIQKNPSVFRVVVSYALPVILGSILYQSSMLAYFYFDGVYTEGLVYYLSTRTVQFAIMLAVESLIIYMLLKMNVFTRLGVWPIKRKEQKA